jgi:hypothetical protein
MIGNPIGHHDDAHMADKPEAGVDGAAAHPAPASAPDAKTSAATVGITPTAHAEFTPSSDLISSQARARSRARASRSVDPEEDETSARWISKNAYKVKPWGLFVVLTITLGVSLVSAAI